MRWLLRKFDALLGTFVAALFGIATSQAQAFVDAYLQRLGGHLDEARLAYARDKLIWVEAKLELAAQTRLAEAAEARIAGLAEALARIEDAPPLIQPLYLARHMDRDIALAAANHFQPALPLDLESLVYGAAGIVLGWLVYSLVTAPIRLLGRPRRDPPAASQRRSAKNPPPAASPRYRRPPTLARPAADTSAHGRAPTPGSRP
ncbi:DUF2937 family protein [Oceanibacterium hippocampi]|uniref:DUF2937 domain-containing protein n=1 Tax=Oceanibacterium hippocampi TaxID=745714 RepID=A0A1Y5SFP2_9PROT|nr:DUF2937 family protein [Oceanibacterium hippocampi]SLN38522.1 hypothetical protein OCH7691_01589 [Oceanibacterium hippocampi]